MVWHGKPVIEESSDDVTRGERSTSLRVGVVLACEDIDHPWETHRWRPIDVVVGISDTEAGPIVKSGPGFVHYFAGTYEIELHRKDGARLRLHAPETSLSTIVQSFLEAR